MTKSALLTTLCIAAILACGESGTGPTIPAEPTGTLLVFHPVETVHLVDLVSGESREVSRNGEPFSWVSPTFDDGANVVIGGGTGVGQPSPGIRQLDLTSGAITTLVEGVNAFATSLAPDGRTLIFAWRDPESPRAGLFTVELGGTAEPERRWTAPDSAPHGLLANLRWLPDQSGLIAHLYELPVVQLVHFDLASRVVTPITEPTITGMTRTLDLSPDGRTIAYNTHTGELRFITLTGKPAPGYPTHLRGLLPAFSPDGRLLVWSRFKDGSLDMDGIWFYRFSDGATWRALPEESEMLGVLDWG